MKMTKHQAKRRLYEARAKILRVVLAGTASPSDDKKLYAMSNELERIMGRIK